jgi:energy-coupling factor transporter ATP-binding protein EcfA2
LPIKIIYRSRKRRAVQNSETDDTPVVELSWNSWDDYSFKTTFDAILHIGAESSKLDQVKILFPDTFNSSIVLEKQIEAGWNGEFPLPTPYVSNPTSLTFYEQLAKLAGLENAAIVAEKLHDASFMTNQHYDDTSIGLTSTDGFRRSLQRERGDKTAFTHGWKVFDGLAMSVENVDFRFRDRAGGIQNIKLNFSSSSLLPHDINLLVGPNGAGKSQLLTQLVDHWLQVPELPDGTGFSEPPTFGRFIAVSYSPFERLRVDTKSQTLAAPDVYSYFGLRGRSSTPNQTTLSLEHARRAATRSLLSCAIDDQRFRAIPLWSQKLHTLRRVLREAIDFDFAAVTVPSTTSGSAFLQDALADSPIVDIPDSDGASAKRRYVKVDEHSGPDLDMAAVSKHAINEDGVTLFKNGVPLEMSSGQRLFSYIVINVLGSIRRNSLILIDEPELFLHPSLEIELISMLKSILKAYSSKALIATHSLVLTREVPRDCVYVFQPTDEGLLIKHPPFQTFGGDVQRISSYVFGDNSVSKPFEKWIDEQAENHGSREAVLAMLPPEDLNEELIIDLTSEAELPQ